MEIIFEIMFVKGLGKRYVEFNKIYINMFIYIQVGGSIDRKVRKVKVIGKDNLRVIEMVIEVM